MTTSVFIATSVDGYIARRDGSIDWLTEAQELVTEGEDCGFAAFMESVDALIMGRNTFEQVLSFGRWPYDKTPVVVLSRTLVSLPKHLPETVSSSSEPPAGLLKRLSSQGKNHIYIDGGATIQSFLAESLIDEITITKIPVVIGDGLPLFGPLENDLKLNHIKTEIYEFGFVQSTYKIERNG